MCGIAGLFAIERCRLPSALDLMSEALIHRGPDDFEEFEAEKVDLAMRRLVTIGFTNGSQPIISEDRNLALILIGEIYNYKNLKRELNDRGHQFSTDSDSEVVVLTAELVLSPTSPLAPLMNQRALVAMWRRLEVGSDSILAMRLWRILNLAVWLDLHLPDGESGTLDT